MMTEQKYNAKECQKLPYFFLTASLVKSGYQSKGGNLLHSYSQKTKLDYLSYGLKDYFLKVNI